MKIGQVLYKAGKILNDQLGCYTKRQCVRISANVGKELVDIKRAGQELTPSILSEVAKKHVPKVNVNIIANSSEYQQIAMSEGFTQDAIEKMLKNAAGQRYNFGVGKRGIFIPTLGTEKDASIFAHEFEHWMYNEHTFLRRLLVRASDKRVETKIKPKVVDAKAYGTSFSGVKKKFEEYIRRFFGINDLAQKDGYKNLRNSHQEITKFLAGENYTGLTNEKRITAYIRAICRKLMHPSKKDSIAQIYVMNLCIKDEARAYKVSDIVSRYATGQKNISREGFISDIYSRVSKVLSKELWVAIKKFGKGNVSKKTGLPTNAYNETRLADIAKKEAKKVAQVMPEKPKPKNVWTKINTQT